LQEAKASQIKLSLKEALYEVIALRRMVEAQVDRPLTEPQLFVSTDIARCCLAGGNHEIDMLWCRRFGKTEMNVQTGITLGLYWIHRRQENFLIGLVNPARNEQSIMVTKMRLQERLTQLEPWMNLTLGIHKILGDGRKTPDYILRDSCGAECQIRAISADASAHEKGAGFNLMFLEQVEEMDEQIMKTIIFPMATGEELQSTQILAGTPGLTIDNHYFADHSRHLKYPFLVEEKTAGRFRPSYRSWVEMEKLRLGETSDEFRTQYGCEWIELRNVLIDRDALLLLAQDYAPVPGRTRYAGTDVAKMVDRTVCTIGERDGENIHIIAWLEMEGVNYEEQVGLITAFLAQYNPQVNVVDATGVGDPVVDMLTNQCRGICRTIPFKFTPESRDGLWKIYERELRQGRFHYPKKCDDEIQERCRKRFFEEHVDVVREVKANKVNIRAQDRKGAHDDYCASGALMIHGATQPDASGLFELRGAARRQ
jgi:hypothetical protein